jgi:signal transduction histidine kinase
MLLRLADTFSELRPLYPTAGTVGLVAIVAALFVVPQPYPTWLVLPLVAYFVVVAVGASLAFVIQAHRSTGVTRRRLQCVAWGSALLGLDILVAGLTVLTPDLSGLLAVVGALCGLGSGVLYFIGFAPPVWLRRTWQEPALRAFLVRSAQLVREPDLVLALHDLQDRAATAVGSLAAVGLWLEGESRLRFYVRDMNVGPRLPPGAAGFEVQPDPMVMDLKPGMMIGGQAFERQQPVFSPDAPRDDPDYADYYRATGALAALAAPITAGDRRLGVLVAYAARAPIFADSDLELVQLLADQAAIVLQSRFLIEDLASARGREEADRLKDEFLASISHDLRNPLTAVRGVTQVLERRLERNVPIEPERLARSLANIRGSTAQMASLIDQMLDYARLQMDRPLELALRRMDLVELTRRTVERFAATSDRHRLVLDASAPALVGEWDEARLERVMQNLVANAIKYSPQGGDVVVQVAEESSAGRHWAVVTVTDPGLGIPADDLPYVFDRFHRGSNVADIPGSGLGLAAARQVLEQHGGSIEVSSTPGQGSTFVVRLPCGESSRE